MFVKISVATTSFCWFTFTPKNLLYKYNLMYNYKADFFQF